MNLILNNMPLLMGVPEGGAAGGGQMTTTLITFGLVFVIFYFLIIRPQNKKQKETKKMLEAIKKGDKVVTIGGIHGTIFSVKTDTIVLKIDDNTKIQMQRSAVSSVVNQEAPKKEDAPKEESKSDESKDNA